MTLHDIFMAYAWPLMRIVGKIVFIVLPLLGAVACLTYAERRVMAAMQLRRGPNVTGPFGLMQPVADGVKLLGKETILPAGTNKVLFLLAPIMAFSLALAAWAAIPFQAGVVLADIMSVSCMCSPSRRSASTAQSSRDGRRTPNTRFWEGCVRQRRWCRTRFPWDLSL